LVSSDWPLQFFFGDPVEGGLIPDMSEKDTEENVTTRKVARE
jgi:hypothetical protein